MTRSLLVLASGFLLAGCIDGVFGGRSEGDGVVFPGDGAPSVAYVRQNLVIEGEFEVIQQNGRRLEMEFVGRNAGDRPIRLAFGGGDLWPAAYDNPERAGSPTWRLEQGVPDDFRGEFVIEPGESVRLPFSYSELVARITESAGAGDYYFEAELRVFGVGFIGRFLAGMVRLE